MSPGLEPLNQVVMQLLLTLALMTLALCAAAAILALALELLRRGAARWFARPRPAASFYVGRLEDSRAAVYVVERDVVRLLFEATPLPASWAQIGDRLARGLAADAIGAVEPPRRGVRRLARRIAKAPQEGFVIERPAVAALAGRSPIRPGAHRLRAAAAGPGSRLRRTLARHLGPWATARRGEVGRTAGHAKVGRRAPT